LKFPHIPFNPNLVDSNCEDQFRNYSLKRFAFYVGEESDPLSPCSGVPRNMDFGKDGGPHLLREWTAKEYMVMAFTSLAKTTLRGVSKAK
jgi:hypothetical protein